MEKLWIECQKCGSIFWVFSSEIGSVYPKSTIDYQICSSCEQSQKKQIQTDMFDYLVNLKDQIAFVYETLKFFFYFCVGALLIFFFRKLFKIFQFFIYKFNKEFFLDKFKFVIKSLIFVFLSIALGWTLVTFIKGKIF